MRFSQVDVFTAVPTLGNALAVVHEADDLDDDQLAAFARWTNLSETTFLLRPTTPDADYRVRIFTTGGELPFAGHPTIGSAHAWLEAGGSPRSADTLVQECGAGLVTVRRRAGRLAFAAPALRRTGPVDEVHLQLCLDACGVTRDGVLAAEWIDNGPGWVGIELDSAERVLAAELDPAAGRELRFGLLGRHPAGSPADVEVRAFYGDRDGAAEDPVTGSLNAGLAQWLIGAGRLPTSYVAGQGRRLNRDGRVFVESDGRDVWIGGDAVTLIAGTVDLRV